MPNLRLISDNQLFFEDLVWQINRYAPEYSINSESAAPDIIIIDENTSLISNLKNQYPQTPILVLLKQGDEKPKENNFIKYENKPLILNDFINKLRSAINLAFNSHEGILRFNKYCLYPLSKEIVNLRNKETIKLTEKEVAIIQYLYKIKDRIVTKTELLQQVWGYSPDVTTHTIETHIYRLRQKVEHDDVDAQLIMTEDGGYILKR